jgi:hypothetical protein
VQGCLSLNDWLNEWGKVRTTGKYMKIPQKYTAPVQAADNGDETV